MGKCPICGTEYDITLPKNKEYHVFRYQLSKSATSMGANYEEAQGLTVKKIFQVKLVSV